MREERQGCRPRLQIAGLASRGSKFGVVVSVILIFGAFEHVAQGPS
jgi:hypothetical protein